MLLLVLALAWVATSITNHILWGGHLARPLVKTAASFGEVAVFLFEPRRHGVITLKFLVFFV